jgi:4-alpha-glucanotransferase
VVAHCQTLSPTVPSLHSTWLRERSSGVLAHVSSLPGEYGIGNLGDGARAFIDFLAEAGFQHWQICPTGPTGFGDSPYQSFSSFAGNPYFIDLGELCRERLLTADEINPLKELPKDNVDYGELYSRFWPILARAYDHFVALKSDAPWGGEAALFEFERLEADWLQSFGTYMALKAEFGGRPWHEWPKAWRDWSPGIEQRLSASATTEAARHRFYQFLFFRQWQALRDYGEKQGVKLIGDVPIFVALDSADTWRWRKVFRLDPEGRPLAISGVPPDYFSDRGQCWGNPLYDWDYLRDTGYDWWIQRLRMAFSLCDVVRLDHFRGFNDFWEIPAGAKDARNGQWLPGPGLAFFEAMRTALPDAKLIAEDLGYISEGVSELRKAACLPGMKVLQFGYGHDDNNVNLPHFFPADAVVYTGTHDNDTTRGWLDNLDTESFTQVAEYFGLTRSDSAWRLLRAAFASVARLVVLPMQDLLELPSTARMNRPGSTEGNWKWRFTRWDLDYLTERRLSTLQHWHRLFDRTGDARQREFSAPPDALPIGEQLQESADSVSRDPFTSSLS